MKHNKMEEKNLTAAMSRIDAIDKMGSIIKKIGLVALPVGVVGLTTKKASAIPNKTKIVQLLNNLLQMEYVVRDLFVKYNNNSTPEMYADSMANIAHHHKEYKIRLKYYIKKLNSTPAAFTPPIYGNFETNGLNPQNNFDDFLQIAQVLEEASVSLYKKYIPKVFDLGADDIIVRMMCRTHTAEARHATYIRMVRAERGVKDLVPWVSLNSNAVIKAMHEIYLNENNTVQNDIEVTSITDVPVSEVQRAWDEPCNDMAINKLFKLFEIKYPF